MYIVERCNQLSHEYNISIYFI